MLNKIKKLMGLSHEIDSKIFRKALVQYPYMSESSGAYIPNITSVRAFQNKGLIKIEIRTHFPGILIGKKGIQIDGIKSFMSQKCGQEVEIFIIEEDMFSHLYDS